MKLFSTTLLLLIGPLSLHAAYVFKEGKLYNKREVATLSVQEHYSLAREAYQKSNWEELVHQSIIVTKNFPTTPFAQEALFYLGVGYFHMNEFDLANENFSSYLKKQTTPKYFEEAIQYKFAIAEQYQKGAKKHVMGWENLPKWTPAIEDAIAIYDEVITALPHHDLATQALYGKAKLLLKEEDYKASIEAYQTLIRRFPKHSLAVESYIGIAEVYLTQCKSEYPDPDFLDLAEINMRKFRIDFPREQRVELAVDMLREMQEIYAYSLYETGKFFERTKKPHASFIYYSKVITTFPETKVAALAKKRLKALKYDPEQIHSFLNPLEKQESDPSAEVSSQETVQESEVAKTEQDPTPAVEIKEPEEISTKSAVTEDTAVPKPMVEEIEAKR